MIGFFYVQNSPYDLNWLVFNVLRYGAFPAYGFGISPYINPKNNRMLILFIISIAVFAYMAYVLIKPEKF